jgi:hypothetical protein
VGLKLSPTLKAGIACSYSLIAGGTCLGLFTGEFNGVPSELRLPPPSGLIALATSIGGFIVGWLLIDRWFSDAQAPKALIERSGDRLTIETGRNFFSTIAWWSFIVAMCSPSVPCLFLFIPLNAAVTGEPFGWEEWNSWAGSFAAFAGMVAVGVMFLSVLFIAPEAANATNIELDSRRIEIRRRGLLSNSVKVIPLDQFDALETYNLGVEIKTRNGATYRIEILGSRDNDQSISRAMLDFIHQSRSVGPA